MAYALMFFAIGMELTGTTLLKYSQGFTKLLPTIGCLVSYFICFFSFSRALNDLNLGLAYAIWSGVGIVLTATIGFLVFRQALDTWALFGMSLIVLGTIVLNTMSRSTVH